MSDIIVHFGVKGMKWGKRKQVDPPVNTPMSAEQQLSAQRRRTMKIAGGMAVTAALAVGMVIVRKKFGKNSPSMKQSVEVAKRFTKTSTGKHVQDMVKRTATSVQAAALQDRLVEQSRRATQDALNDPNRAKLLAYDDQYDFMKRMSEQIYRR